MNQGGKGRCSAVNAINLISGLQVKRYSSITEAAAAMSVCRGYITDCLRGLRDGVGGFGWQFASGKNFIIPVCRLKIYYLNERLIR